MKIFGNFNKSTKISNLFVALKHSFIIDDVCRFHYRRCGAGQYDTDGLNQTASLERTAKLILVKTIPDVKFDAMMLYKHCSQQNIS